MTSTLDTELRAAALARVAELREMYAGRIPRTALMDGVSAGGERIPLWNYQKGIFKPATFGRDGAALSIQTSADSPYGDVHDADAGRIAYKYRGSDPMHRDNVSLRRARFELVAPVRETPHGSVLTGSLIKGRLRRSSSTSTLASNRATQARRATDE